MEEKITYFSETKRLLNKSSFSKWEKDEETSRKTFGGPGMLSRNAFACMWQKTQFIGAHITKGQGGRQLLELGQQLDNIKSSFPLYLLQWNSSQNGCSNNRYCTYLQSRKTGDGARTAIFACFIRKPKAFPGLLSPQQTSATPYGTYLCHVAIPTCGGAWESACLITPCFIAERTKAARNWYVCCISHQQGLPQGSLVRDIKYIDSSSNRSLPAILICCHSFLWSGERQK